ncbi:sinapoylglucose--choline O-sinapoyltransferase [Trifolium repens]|nr:sinapoylglucose--choline O-sinapoyltransferase [Trifolium repens]
MSVVKDEGYCFNIARNTGVYGCIRGGSFSLSLILCHELAHHHRITSSPPQPIVFNKEWAKSISGAFNFTIASLDQPLVFNFILQFDLTIGFVLLCSILMGYLLGNSVTTEKETNYKIPFAHGMGLISDELYESLQKNCNGDYVNVETRNVLCSRDMSSFSEYPEMASLYL